MRIIIALISLLLIFFSAVFILNKIFQGIFQVFSIFPDWVYILTVVFVFLAYNYNKPEKKEAIAKTQKPINNINESIEMLPEDNVDQNCDSKFDNTQYEYIRWHENKQPLVKFYPVKIKEQNKTLITPYDISYYDYETPTEYQDHRKFGEMKIEQIVLIQLGSSISQKRKRETNIILPIEELEKKKVENQWLDNSLISGKITISESLRNTWVNAQERNDSFGLIYKGNFFEVIEFLSFSENPNTDDTYLTKEEAQKSAEYILKNNPDNLPF